jgi:hypothetical protein
MSSIVKEDEEEEEDRIALCNEMKNSWKTAKYQRKRRSRLETRTFVVVVSIVSQPRFSYFLSNRRPAVRIFSFVSKKLEEKPP